VPVKCHGRWCQCQSGASASAKGPRSACQTRSPITRVKFKLRPKCMTPNPSDTRVARPFIHHSTRVPIAVRLNSPPLAGLAPHPIPYPPWLQISTSSLPTYWAALFPSVAGESHKIQAFRPSSRFVPLGPPLSFSSSPFAMGGHFSSVGKRDITSCTYCFILTPFRVSPNCYL